MPLPASEPAVSLLSPFGPVVIERSKTAPGAALMSCALPGVEFPSNSTLPLLMMAALPAVVLVSKVSWLLLMMAALAGRGGVGETTSDRYS